MIKRFCFALLALSSILWVSAQAAEEPLRPEQLNARFYFDLGPSEIDVSSYPETQKANYALFAKTCSRCHTLARPINSPLAERKDWSRFVRRMHLKAKTIIQTGLSGRQAEAIVDFLTYDSNIRKVVRKKEFEAEARALKAKFKEAQKERMRLQAEKDKRKTKEPAPYVGDSPRP